MTRQINDEPARPGLAKGYTLDAPGATPGGDATIRQRAEATARADAEADRRKAVARAAERDARERHRSPEAVAEAAHQDAINRDKDQRAQAERRARSDRAAYDAGRHVRQYRRGVNGQPPEGKITSAREAVEALSALNRNARFASPEVRMKAAEALTFLTMPTDLRPSVLKAETFRDSVLAKVEAEAAQKITATTAAWKDETDALRAELATLRAKPTAGTGPVFRVRSPHHEAKRDQATLAEQYAAKALDTPDPALRAGYTALAEQHRNH